LTVIDNNGLTGSIAHNVTARSGVRPVASFGQGKGKARLAYLQLGWAATEIIHKEDLLGKRGWQAEYTVVPGSPSALVNAFAAKTWTPWASTPGRA
jgi:hypothetical protein